MIPKIAKRSAVVRIARIAADAGIDLYLVGGVVRDSLTGQNASPANIDFLVSEGVDKIAGLVAQEFKSRVIKLNPKFDTCMVPYRKVEYEFSGPKKDLIRATQKTALPSDLLTRDLILRDFTINAIAFSLNPTPRQFHDPAGGIKDLEQRAIRTPLDPHITLQEDPLRIMRAIRFAAQLDFSIAPDLMEAMHDLKESLLKTAVERRTAELLKILAAPKPSLGFKLMYVTGVLDVAYPEIAALAKLNQQSTKRRHHKDVFEHTMKVLDTVAETGGELDTRLAALLHDIGKPATRRYDAELGWTFHGHEVIGQRMVRKLGKQWRLSTTMIDRVSKMVRLHMRPINLSDEGVTDSAVRRLGVQAGADIEELIRLCRADVTSADPRKIKRYLENFERVVAHLVEVEERDELRAFQSPVRGEEIMAETGLRPGPMIGKLKKAIEEAILDGIIPHEHDAALEYLRKIKDELAD
ncbi:CCA tRNA nucleotidyltransferase [bacterium]|nr:CCA tRNA nucleotidyltransferase [bacterium]MBU1651225.1 CCA tRNA nucleotidyltransferase [bacterium]